MLNIYMLFYNDISPDINWPYFDNKRRLPYFSFTLFSLLALNASLYTTSLSKHVVGVQKSKEIDFFKKKDINTNPASRPIYQLLTSHFVDVRD